MAIELTGATLVSERGTIVTYRQRCEECGHTYSYNKTTVVPAFGTRKCRAFTCPRCGNYQEVSMTYYREK